MQRTDDEQDAKKGNPKVTVRVASPRDGVACTKLAALVAGDRASDQGGDLGEYIERRGGRHVPTPYGSGTVLVAEVGGKACGMIYTCPPVSWIEQHPVEHREMLAGRITQLELLSVVAPMRAQGIGSALLHTMETRRWEQGITVCAVKIRRGDFPAMLWYRKQGYTIVPQGCGVTLRVQDVATNMNDGNDGYQLGVKELR